MGALADGGQDGVQGLLPAVHDDLSHVAALAGAARLDELDRSWVVLAGD